MLSGLAIVPVVSLITKRPEKSVVDSMFECYYKEVVVASKDHLGGK